MQKIDWQLLRDEGLKYLTSMSNHIWTDYNIHDPGVTLLETLCYGINDLHNRLSINIDEILAESADDKETLKQFFTPAEILTVNPLTKNDFRKLLIDIEGVRNAWIESAVYSEQALYYDPDTGRRSHYFSPSSERILMNGLHKVLIEKEDDISTISEQQLKNTIKETLHAHRNLCEDFVEVKILQHETLYLFADIAIDGHTDANDLMASIYFNLESFIEPTIKQYSLKRLLHDNRPVEEIFNGPHLNNGFILDEDLALTEKKHELHLSDLIQIIMGEKTVKDIHFLYAATIADPGYHDRQEWVLSLDNTKGLRLVDIEKIRIRLLKDDIETPLDINIISENIKKRKKERLQDLYQHPLQDIPTPLDRGAGKVNQNGLGLDVRIPLDSYESVQKHLPENYGLSELGLPLETSAERRAQVSQLRGFLLFFDQLLANYFKQFERFKNTFAVSQPQGLNSYFSQILSRVEPENEQRLLFGEIYDQQILDSLLKNDDLDYERRNRILNHLLARFNETFTDYAMLSCKKMEYLEGKANFLKNYWFLSRDRNRANNYYLKSIDNSQKLANDGLKDIIIGKLCLTDDEKEKIFFLEHILIRPHGSSSLAFANFEGEDSGVEKSIADVTINSEDSFYAYRNQLENNRTRDPYSYRLTCVLPNDVGRFINDRTFIASVLQTLDKEIPAHIDYEVLRLDSDGCENLLHTYSQHLQLLRDSKQSELSQYSSYREELLKTLAIGYIAEAVFHLDVSDADSLSIVTDSNDKQRIQHWSDLSNYKHQIQISDVKQPELIPEIVNRKAAARFDQTQLYTLADQSSFLLSEVTIAIVYKVPDDVSQTDTINSLISITSGSAEIAEISNLQLTVDTRGTVKAKLKSVLQQNSVMDNNELMINSTTGIFHMAILVGKKLNQQQQSWQLFIDSAMSTGMKNTPSLDMRDHDSLNNEESVVEKLTIGESQDSVNNELIDIAEVIVIKSALKGNRKEQLEQYLSAKWHIALSASSSLGVPQLHLDAGVEAHFVKNQQGRVEQWHDLSFTNHEVRQTLVALQPYYQHESFNDEEFSRQAVRHVGFFSNAAIKFKHSQLSVPNVLSIGFCIAVVFEESSQRYDESADKLANSILIDISPLTGENYPGQFRLSINNQHELVVESTASQLSVKLPHFGAHIVIIEKASNSDVVSIYLNGQYQNNHVFSDAALFSQCPPEMSLGHRRVKGFNNTTPVNDENSVDAFDGTLAELIIYNDALSIENRQLLEKSLSCKWKIDISGINSVSVPLVHLDAHYLQSIVKDSLQQVSSWYNRSEGCYTDFEIDQDAIKAEQSIAYRRPHYVQQAINDLPALAFSKQIYLSLPRVVSDDFTILLVFQVSSGGTVTKQEIVNEFEQGEELWLELIDREWLLQELPDAVKAKVTLTTNRELAGLGDDFVSVVDRVVLFLRHARGATGHFNWTEGAGLIDGDSSGQYNDFGLSVADNGAVMAGIGDRLGSDTTLTSPALDFDRPHILSFSRSYANGEAELYLDGQRIGKADLRDKVKLNDPKTLSIGAIRNNGASLDGYIGEVIVLDKTLTSIQRLTVEQHLAAKWRLSLSGFTAIAEPFVHLDASRQESIITQDATDILFWHDARTNSFDGINNNTGEELLANSLATRNFPVFQWDQITDRAAVYFEQSAMSLPLSLDTACTFIIMLQPAYGVSDQELEIVLLDTDDISIRLSEGSENTSKLSARVGNRALMTYVSHLQPILVVLSWDATSQEVKLYLNGLQEDAGITDLVSLAGSTLLTMGATNIAVDKYQGFYRGHVFEIAVFNQVLDEVKRQQAENYLAMKWRLTLSAIQRITDPVLHLDSSRRRSVVVDDTNQVAKWIETSGRELVPVTNNGLINKQQLLDKFVQGELIWQALIDYSWLRKVHNNHGIVDTNETKLSVGLGVEIAPYINDIVHLMEQAKSRAQIYPQYYIGTVNDLSVIHLSQSNFSLPRTIQHDFTILVVYKAYQGSTEVPGSTINWKQGLGLVDASLSGDEINATQREFGLSVGFDGQLIAGVSEQSDQSFSTLSISVPAALNQWHLAVFRREKTTGKFWLSVDSGTPIQERYAREVSLKDSPNITIGALNQGGNYFQGELAEIIILDSLLDNNDQQSVQQLLMKKWDIQ